jgi:hypothetical protein
MMTRRESYLRLPTALGDGSEEGAGERLAAAHDGCAGGPESVVAGVEHDAA